MSRSARLGDTFLVALAATLPGPVMAQEKSVPMTVHADRPGPVIDRAIFGQFAEQLGNGIYGGVWVGPDSPIPNVRGIRSDVVRALRAIKVPNVRWPGGCFADQYHWRNGIGPADKRKVTYNINWGSPVEPNTFGTHEYMDFIEQIGSQAYITVNVGSGTVQEAADWVEYLTTDKPTTLAKERAANGHPAPYSLPYLGIGNETYGCGGALSPETYLQQLKTFTMFARNLNPAETGTSRFVPGARPMIRVASGPPDTDTDYTETLMKAWPASSSRSWGFEALSFHHYTAGDLGTMRDPASGFGEKEYVRFVKNTYEMDGLIAKNVAIMDKYDPAKKVGLVIDEWGVWLRGMPGVNPFYLQQQNSLRDAILASVNLNIFARHADRVRMANIAQMINVLQSMILTDKEKMVLTPTYYVYKMYVPFQDATVLPVDLAAGQYSFGDVSVPRVDAIAARGKDGGIWLALTNLDPNKAVAIDARVPGTAPKSASGEVLTAERIDAVNTFDAPPSVVPKPFAAQTRNGRLTLTLAPGSVTVVRLAE